VIASAIPRWRHAGAWDILFPVSEPAQLLPFEISARLADLAENWAGSSINERAGFQTWLIRFCEALEVEPPDPPTDDYPLMGEVTLDADGRYQTARKVA
jgi:hypothetical protein